MLNGTMSKSVGSDGGLKRKATHDIELAAAVVHGHITSFADIFAVSEELVHELGEGEATLFEDTGLSVLSEDDVFWGQSRGGANCYSFFTSRYLLVVSPFNLALEWEV